MVEKTLMTCSFATGKRPIGRLTFEREHLKRPAFMMRSLETGNWAPSRCFQKISKCDRHAPRSHINHVLPIETAEQGPAEVVQIAIEDDRNPRRSLFVVAKNITVANYGDTLAGLRIDNIAVEHVFCSACPT
jgi:hypothetical protein